MTQPKLTPTQDLLVELLAARFRLGEREWTVSRVHQRALTGLIDLGLVTVRGHNADPGCVYAALTAEGRKLTLSDEYRPPAPPPAQPGDEFDEVLRWLRKRRKKARRQR